MVVDNLASKTSSLKARSPYYAYRVGSAIANALPESIAARLFNFVARVAAVFMPAKRRLVARNLQRVRGINPNEATQDSGVLNREVASVFTSYARYWLELFRLPGETPAEIIAKFQIEGGEHLEAALARGKGLIATVPHVGGFDYSGAWFAASGHRPAAVVEALEPPELLSWFTDLRSSVGVEVIPLGRDSAPRVSAALSENRLVCLMTDRDISGDGVPVEFFGEQTTMPGGPALLALRTGAALLPIVAYFAPNGMHHGVIQAPILAEREGRLREDVVRVTQEIAYRFEEMIRVAPEQWHLLQPNWPSDRGELAQKSDESSDQKSDQSSGESEGS
ncbi:MAG: hypothetical protein RLY23_972 [Actinomycetota bacterium]